MLERLEAWLYSMFLRGETSMAIRRALIVCVIFPLAIAQAIMTGYIEARRDWRMHWSGMKEVWKSL